jgi:hypothetical protein
MVGVLFPIMMLPGNAPALYALPTGLADFAVGLAAPWVARGFARGTGRRRAVRFNVVGIAGYTVALVTGTVSSLVFAGSLGMAVAGPPRTVIVPPSCGWASILHPGPDPDFRCTSFCLFTACRRR